MTQPLARRRVTQRVLHAAALAALLTASVSQAQTASTASNPATTKLIEEAAAKPTPRTADGKPDLSGFWELPMFQVGAGPFAGKPRTSEDGKTISLSFPSLEFINKRDGVNAAARGANTAARPVYKSPEDQAKAQNNFDTGDNNDPSFGCLSPGVPRIGMPSEIVQTKDTVYLLYQFYTHFRIIPVDGRKHDPDAETMPDGNSIGYWDGDTLVIETVALSPETWLNKDGSFHGEDTRVFERITRKGNTLVMRTTVEDPIFAKPFEVLEGPVPAFTATGTLVLGKPGQHVAQDYDCTSRNREHMNGTGKH